MSRLIDADKLKEDLDGVMKGSTKDLDLTNKYTAVMVELATLIFDKIKKIIDSEPTVGGEDEH